MSQVTAMPAAQTAWAEYMVELREMVESMTGQTEMPRWAWSVAVMMGSDDEMVRSLGRGLAGLYRNEARMSTKHGLTMRRAAGLLRVNLKTLQWWVAEGRIPTVQFGKRRLISEETVRGLASGELKLKGRKRNE